VFLLLLLKLLFETHLLCLLPDFKFPEELLGLVHILPLRPALFKLLLHVLHLVGTVDHVGELIHELLLGTLHVFHLHPLALFGLRLGGEAVGSRRTLMGHVGVGGKTLPVLHVPKVLYGKDEFKFSLGLLLAGDREHAGELFLHGVLLLHDGGVLEAEEVHEGLAHQLLLGAGLGVYLHA